MKTPQPYFLLSREALIVSVILIKEWEGEKPDLKPNCFGNNILLSLRKFVSLVVINFSIILLKIGNRDIGL